jgi:hypothetical protein
MIRLELKREPTWLDLGHGVRVHVRPCTTALVMAARAAVVRGGDQYDETAAGQSAEASASAKAPADTSAKAGEQTAALVKTLARLAVDDWEGVGNAEGEPAKVTPEGVEALMDLWPIAESFERQYLGPALLLDAEKNA